MQFLSFYYIYPVEMDQSLKSAKVQFHMFFLLLF